ncbi:PREDICTED: gamma-glutamylaminecyclotransferase-like [Branchiostoma belcheri]|uniref:Gamma-glutamylcyclotransferase family protein n=1 Tax=Branchiostoma belcheri TaxID=7741 RepID=A0A6P4ZG89_BRABE|nr:PREDICTED: gamma-glutamylaminecyclotransferase-like [Branchiostoma belcheri]
MMSMIRVFVYGTLKRGQPNYHYMVNTDNGVARFVGKARTVDRWPLVVASKYNIPFLLDLRGQGEHVEGEIYDVDQKMADFLDDFESHPSLYQNTTLAIEQLTNEEDQDLGDGKVTHQCSVYLLKQFKPHLAQLPCLSNYSSQGVPGVNAYMERYLRDPQEGLDFVIGEVRFRDN